MRQSHDLLDRLIERFDQLDSSSVQGYLLRLMREKGLLETIFQTIHEGVLIVDRHLQVHYVNNAAMSLLGLPKDIREREDPHLDRYLRDIDWHCLLSQDPSTWERASRQEIEILYPEHRYIQFYMLPYRDEAISGDEDDSHLVALILQDVTEMRAKTESAIESERLSAITMLAAGVAHEIGNPLNSLTIHLQLLQRYFRKGNLEAGKEDAEDLIKIALDEVNRLDTIISQFLKAVRPTPLEVHDLSIPKIVEETLDILKMEISNRAIQVECEWSDQSPFLRGDANQLKQAIYNIVNNAIQAMPDGGKLHIIVRHDEKDLIVAFADTGKGIAPEELGNIFNPYYTTKKTGTGLGLVIVERIIRDHGGTLSIESEEGVGTQFTLRFPRYERRTRLLPGPEAVPPQTE